MRVVLQSGPYWPLLGGVETLARLLAEEFSALGHTTSVITDTPGAGEDKSSVRVIRQASLGQRLAALRDADVVLMFGLSLRFLPLPILQRRPTVICHHGMYEGWRPAAVLKRCVNRLTRNIAPSQAVARALRAPATLIPNAYDDAVFRRRPEIARTGDLVFVGRFVSQKGLELLIEALALLARDGVRPALTVIGSGPEEARCRQAAATLGVERQLTWAGSLHGEALATALNRHRVLVVPSLGQEAFGIVALEGMACGCVVVGANSGGLPEAIGPGGRTFRTGDVRALASTLRAALEQAGQSAPEAVDAHLRRHDRRVVAQRYLEVLHDAAGQA
jgi:glycogen(starch) synthase